MKLLIIEDETAAAVNLQAILRELVPNATVDAVLETVVDSVEWLQTHHAPDLIFMDIHLADGDSFRIFQAVEVKTPVIFTTAYDQYALEAFKVSSIDYLLKPLRAEDVRRAVEKWHNLTRTERSSYTARVDTLAAEHNRGQELFLVHQRDRIIPLRPTSVAFFYTADDQVTAYTLTGEHYRLDRTLDKLQEQLQPSDFFRANRQYIVARQAIKDISVWFGNRLKLNLTVETPESIIISKMRVPVFKQWLVDSPAN